MESLKQNEIRQEIYWIRETLLYMASYRLNLFAISSESVIIKLCSCIHEILIGLHFVRFLAKFRIFYVALKLLLFSARRVS